MVSKVLAVPFWTCSAIGALYAVFLGLLTNPWLQRHALYANHLHSAWWNDITKPESFGFAKNQVTAFNITTPDGETLFAWHVLPLNLYAHHAQALASQPAGLPFEETLQYALLKDDPTANLVISFHGNAGHIAEGQRPASLRALASLPAITTTAPRPDARFPAGLVNTHVLTFDYRGFGHSTGRPTEAGLITDALAVLHAARTRLAVPAHRTVLLGTSLGTAVVAGALDALVNATSGTKPQQQQQQKWAPADTAFAGLVVTSGFDALPNLLKTYLIGGVVPVLSPVAGYPRVLAYLTASLADTWLSAERWTRVVRHHAAPRGGLAGWVGKSSGVGLRVHVLHAKDDFEIRWQHSDLLFEGCVRGLPGGEEDVARVRRGVSGVLSEREGWTKTGKGGGLSGSWTRVEEAAGVQIRQTLVEWGGHNNLIGYAPTVLAVWDMFNGVKD